MKQRRLLALPSKGHPPPTPQLWIPTTVDKAALGLRETGVTVALSPKGGGREAGTQSRLEKEIRERVPGITQPTYQLWRTGRGELSEGVRCPGGKVEKKHHNRRQGQRGARPETSGHPCTPDSKAFQCTGGRTRPGNSFSLQTLTWTPPSESPPSVSPASPLDASSPTLHSRCSLGSKPHQP